MPRILTGPRVNMRADHEDTPNEMAAKIARHGAPRNLSRVQVERLAAWFTAPALDALDDSWHWFGAGISQDAPAQELLSEAKRILIRAAHKDGALAFHADAPDFFLFR
jgi:hypothetical protein